MKKKEIGVESYTIKVTGLPKHENAYELCGELIQHLENVSYFIYILLRKNLFRTLKRNLETLILLMLILDLKTPLLLIFTKKSGKLKGKF